MYTPKIHLMQHIHNTGHWCSVHMLHDARFWRYMLLATLLIGLIALVVFAMRDMQSTVSPFPNPYYPYGG